MSRIGQRVAWNCGTEECGQCCTGTHYGATVDISHAHAVDRGLTADPPNEVAVAFDDRPGVLQFHAWSELEVLR